MQEICLDWKKQKEQTINSTIKDIRILLDQKKEVKQLKTEQLQILEIFLSMKKKKIIINQ